MASECMVEEGKVYEFVTNDDDNPEDGSHSGVKLTPEQMFQQRLRERTEKQQAKQMKKRPVG